MRRRVPPRRRLCAVAAAVTVSTTAWTATGCSASLDTLPLPAPSVGSGSYSLTATFDNALNLPVKAKVRLDGADVGEVASMQADNYTAVVSMRIESGVRIPAGSTAELRSATPLGDVFVQLAPPPHPNPAAPDLGDGANISLPSTSAAATIEELLTRASLLVSGGAIENLTRLANNLGRAVGGRGDRLADMIAQTTQLVNNLAARSNNIRDVLATTANLSATLAAQRPGLGDAVAAAGPALLVIGENTQNIVDLIGQVNRISQQLSHFPSVNGTNDGSLISSVNKLAAGLNTAATNPNVDLNGLNSILPIIVKVTDASSAHVDVDVAELALGAAPDPNTPADPGAKPPDLTDWVNFVGSLEYTLDRVNDHIRTHR
ncbi:MlaD family protein [Nocardia sp. CA2R105]|uniref:MlaD family protein n=1 Tax=Nocardia coffeae TaxID=2873381 RepID=UPI001CA764CA|nr:MlaD family protein [Nocardia coffeae]MBY8856584.1 MlaD family protein [Nocardia coffeae]